MGEEGDYYTYRYNVTTRMAPVLRWAGMRAILMFHCEGQSHKTLSTDHNFLRERRAEADSSRGPSAYQPNTLPLGQTGSLSYIKHDSLISNIKSWYISATQYFKKCRSVVHAELAFTSSLLLV